MSSVNCGVSVSLKLVSSCGYGMGWERPRGARLDAATKVAAGDPMALVSVVTVRRAKCSFRFGDMSRLFDSCLPCGSLPEVLLRDCGVGEREGLACGMAAGHAVGVERR